MGGQCCGIPGNGHIRRVTSPPPFTTMASSTTGDGVRDTQTAKKWKKTQKEGQSPDGTWLRQQWGRPEQLAVAHVSGLKANGVVYMSAGQRGVKHVAAPPSSRCGDLLFAAALLALQRLIPVRLQMGADFRSFCMSQFDGLKL